MKQGDLEIEQFNRCELNSAWRPLLFCGGQDPAKSVLRDVSVSVSVSVSTGHDDDHDHDFRPVTTTTTVIE
jgi:hypothetical protein